MSIRSPRTELDDLREQVDSLCRSEAQSAETVAVDGQKFARHFRACYLAGMRRYADMTREQIRANVAEYRKRALRFYGKPGGTEEEEAAAVEAMTEHVSGMTPDEWWAAVEPAGYGRAWHGMEAGE